MTWGQEQKRNYIYIWKKILIDLASMVISYCSFLALLDFLAVIVLGIYVPRYQSGVGVHIVFWDGSRWCGRQWWHRLKTSCPLCNLNNFWNILMILGRNVDQDEMTCHIQGWQLWLSYFWSYHPLFYLKKISCPLCNSKIPFGIFWWYMAEM